MISIREVEGNSLKRFPCFEKNENWIEETFQPVDYANTKTKVTILLKQRNLSILNEKFEEITNPKNKQWRNWWNVKEAKKIIEPDLETKETVINWIKNQSYGINSIPIDIKDFGDIFRIETSINNLEILFQTKLKPFRSIENFEYVIYRAISDFYIPDFIDENIDFILGLYDFPNPKLSQFGLRKQNDEFIDNYNINNDVVIPWTINERYSVNSQQVSNFTSIDDSTVSSVCVVQFQNNISFLKSDLEYFQESNELPLNDVSDDNLIGEYNSPPGEYESSLDIQYATGISLNATNWFWTVEGWILDFSIEFQLYQLENENNFPYVLSMSWGWTENTQCEFVNCFDSRKYVERCNTELQIITGTGVTILAAAGDQGAAGQDNANCTFSIFEEPLNPLYPATSPFVLSIGATMFVENNATDNLSYSHISQSPPNICTNEFNCINGTSPTIEEIACMYPKSKITTGGGFSFYSEMPYWQKKQVTEYLENEESNLPPSILFNSTNRAIPDVSIVGSQILIRLNEKWNIQDGTSCSTPIWAGLITLLNQQQFNMGLPSLGFINPLLYLIYEEYNSNNTVFNDITKGNNHCTMEKCCEYGYPTSVGYDVVTGLGSINFDALSIAIQNINNNLKN